MFRVQGVLYRRPPIYCINEKTYFSNTIVAKKDSSADQSKETVQLDNNRHAEFTRNFVSTLKLSIPQALEPPPVDKAVQEADQRMAAALRNLFNKQKEEMGVTKELLQRRQELKERYPELFKDLK